MGLVEILQVFSLLIYMQGKFMWKINKMVPSGFLHFSLLLNSMKVVPSGK